MERFLVRIELHSARSMKDYELLHDEMEARGFRCTITSSDGITYHLPPAEYSCVGDADKSVILNEAKKAAEATGHDYGVVVCQGQSVWFGLVPVK